MGLIKKYPPKNKQKCRKACFLPAPQSQSLRQAVVKSLAARGQVRVVVLQLRDLPLHFDGRHGQPQPAGQSVQHLSQTHQLSPLCLQGVFHSLKQHNDYSFLFNNYASSTVTMLNTVLSPVSVKDVLYVSKKILFPLFLQISLSAKERDC